MKDYELFVPSTYNDGSAVDEKFIDAIGELLLTEFGGVTYSPQRHEGRWRMGSIVFHDKIVIFRVLAKDVKKARRFFKRLKTQLKIDLRQEEILILEKDAETI